MNDKNNTSQCKEILFTEAPASWNTRYVDPNGFECQLTLRAETGQELLDKVKGAIAYLLENGSVPAFRILCNCQRYWSGNGLKAVGPILLRRFDRHSCPR